MIPDLSRLLKQSFYENSQLNALWVNEKYYTYSSLGKKTNAIIPKFNKSRIEGKPIIIITHDSAETYATIIAAFISGTGFVPIGPSFPIERGRKIIGISGALQVFSSDQRDVNLFSGQNIEVVCTENSESDNSRIEATEIDNYDKIACILFTSGSTGEPKGVPMSYRNIDTTLDSYFALGYGPGKEGRSLQMFEFTFDMSLISYLPALLSGTCVYSIVDDKRRFFTAFKIINDFRLTFAVFVPSTLAFMRKYFFSVKFPALQCCLVGGEPFPLNLAMEWAECAPNSRIINISGPTETTMACMGYEVTRIANNNKTLNGILAFGKPWKNTTAIVVNEKLDVLNVDEKGELCFAGENVMNGYINNPERNKEAFFKKIINGKELKFYRTGDGAYYDTENDFYSCGRIDLQVKIQGYRVEPEEIEAVARIIIPNTLIVAIPYKKHDGFYAIRLFLESTECKTDLLKNALISQLPPYMVPDEITIINPMPLNANGKIDRNHLKNILEK